MRSGYGSPREDIGPPVIPDGSNAEAGSPDANGVTVIGEVCLCIIKSRGDDNDT